MLEKDLLKLKKFNTDLLNYFFICLIIILPQNYFILSRHQLLDALKMAYPPHH